MGTNSVTGDALISRPASQEYLDNYDRIFRSNKEQPTTTESDNETDKEDSQQD